MTDEKTAVVVPAFEWERLKAIEKEAQDLFTQSQERVAALTAIQVQMNNLKEAHRRALNEYSAHLEEVAKKHNDQRSAARRANTALLLALKTMDALLKALTDSNMDDARHYFPGEVYRAMQDAREVIKAHGFPF